MTRIWYASYGSNVSPRRFSKYLGVEPDSVANRSCWLAGSGRLFTAGESKKWDGAVLFVDPCADGIVIYRVYHLTAAEFLAVWAGENDLSILPQGDQVIGTIRDMQVFDSMRIKINGKYDMAISVNRFGKDPVVTITTSKPLKSGPPGEDYLAIIAEGLKDAPITDEFRIRYVERIRSNVGRLAAL